MWRNQIPGNAHPCFKIIIGGVPLQTTYRNRCQLLISCVTGKCELLYFQVAAHTHTGHSSTGGAPDRQTEIRSSQARKEAPSWLVQAKCLTEPPRVELHRPNSCLSINGSRAGHFQVQEQVFATSFQTSTGLGAPQGDVLARAFGVLKQSTAAPFVDFRGRRLFHKHGLRVSNARSTKPRLV